VRADLSLCFAELEKLPKCYVRQSERRLAVVSLSASSIATRQGLIASDFVVADRQKGNGPPVCPQWATSSASGHSQSGAVRD
jgi:hypothetical protein